MKDALRWLRKGNPARPLTDAYMRRYRVGRWIAREELMSLGYKDDVQIESYEKQGIEWEYMYDPYSDEMKPVPAGTQQDAVHRF
jgi:hypothetical protein